ncbi:MAG: phosphatidate cytidylyltransferase, partial [Thiotrichales bacterium]|nr:phosphatidate cytidylyltransferase [Thiotrichales bacterium]
MLMPRIFTALLLVILVVAGIFYASTGVWFVAIIALSVLALWEWAKLAQCHTPRIQVLYTVLGAGLITLIVRLLESPVVIGLTLLVLLFMVRVVIQYQKSAGLKGIASVRLRLLLGFVLTLLLAKGLIGLQALVSPWLLLLSLAVVWVMDTGAYFSGRRFGKRKLAVHVSPGKSWEGVWGGALSTFLFACLILQFAWSEFSLQDNVLLALLLTAIALFSVFGDLFESVLKRQAGLKDSGRCLPGHGGILDRIDSLLVAVPLSY